MMRAATIHTVQLRQGIPGTWPLVYVAAYTGYLFVHQESELWHWLTMVLLPLLLVRLAERPSSLAALLGSVGLRRASAARGLGLALLIGLLVTLVQLMNRRQRTELEDILADPAGAVLVLLSFVLLVGTAAFTEEVLFRGVLLERLQAQWHSRMAALAVSALAFGLYHLPYLLLRSSSPSAGDLARSLTAALSLAVVGGLPLGWLYLRSGGNLVAPIFAHALMNLVPATRYVASL